MTISFIFFRALFHLICIYKIQANFLELLKSAGKRVFTPGTRVAPGEYPGVVSRCGLSGHVAHPENARGWSPGVGVSGHVTNSDGVPEGLSARALRTRGELGRCLGG